MKPHAVPSHVAVLFAGGAQAVHDEVPHVATLVLLTHAAPHRWKPVLQVKPHAVPLHVAVALEVGAQAVHDEVPQLATLVLLTHAPAHG